MPANATSVDVAKKACVAKSADAGATFQFDSSGGQPRGVAKKAVIKHVDMYLRIFWDDCGTNSKVKSVVYYADPTDFTGCFGGIVQNFKFNGNVVGTWNLPEVTLPCTSGTGLYAYSMTNPKYPETVSASDPANIRCLGADVQLSLSCTPDKSGATASKCVA